MLFYKLSHWYSILVKYYSSQFASYNGFLTIPNCILLFKRNLQQPVIKSVKDVEHLKSKTPKEVNNTLINHLYKQYNQFLKEPCWSSSPMFADLDFKDFMRVRFTISWDVLSSFCFIYTGIWCHALHFQSLVFLTPWLPTSALINLLR